MNSSKTTIGILARQIVPAVAALSLFATSAQADSAGVTLINNKLGTIPGIKAGTNVLTAKPNDLLHALCLALDTLPSTATAADIGNVVEAALESVGGKARKDKDKIAGQVIATAISNNNITDAAVLEAHIAVPYALSELGSYSGALQRYTAATEAFTCSSTC